MHVLIYYPGDLRRPTGTPIRTWNLVWALSHLGARITLLAVGAPNVCLPDYRFIAIRPHSSWITRVRDLSAVIRQSRPELLFSITHNALAEAALSALICRVPHVIDLHSIVVEEMKADGKASWWARWKVAVAERLLLPLCAGATTVSYPLQKHYRRLQRNIEVIHGGVDVGRFNPDVAPAQEIEALHAPNEEGLVVGYVGNLRPYQGVQELFDVAVRIVQCDPSFRFVFIGDGPLKETLMSGLERSGADGHICFVPQKPYAEIPAYLAACDALVIPRPSNKITEFAFPSKLPEYLAMGKVVIATDVGDAKVFVKDGETGYLVPADDTDGLYAAILSQKSNTRRREVGERAFQLMKEEHSWDARAEALLQFFRKVTQRIR